MAIDPLSAFDVALARRFDEYDSIGTALDGSDLLLIRNVQTGVTFSLSVSALGSFVNGALSQSAVLAALSAPNGVATLDSGGKVPAAQLPASLALGETSSTAYRGDRGKTAYDHSQATGNPHGTTKANVGLGNVDNTADTSKPVSTAQQAALDLKANKALPSITAPTLLNSWVDYAGGFQTAGYYKDEFGFVHLTGIVKSGTAGSTIFTLPVGFRPAAGLQFPVAANGYGSCRVSADGSVIAFAGSTVWYSLDGVCFRAA